MAGRADIAIDRTTWASVALLGGGIAPFAPRETCAAAFLVVALACAASSRGRGAILFAVALLAFAFGAGRAWSQSRARETALRDAALTLPRIDECAFAGHVTNSPVLAHGVARWEAEIDVTSCARSPPIAWHGDVALYGGPLNLAHGDSVEGTARLAPFERFWSEANDPRPLEARRRALRSGSIVDVRVTARGHGILASIDHARAWVRSRIEATFPEETAPMARALVLGEADLAAEDDAAFRTSGLSHLLAVSGMHLVLVVVGAVGVVRAVLVRIEALAGRYDVGRFAAAIGVPLAWCYALFAGASGSAVRAAWMLTAGLGARVIARKPNGTRALALSVIAMTLIDPLAAYDVSFGLSVAATAGILLFASRLGDALTSRSAPKFAPIARSIAVTIAATIPCAPLLARFAPTLPAAGILANLIAVPAGEIAALPLCLAHTLLAPWPSAERGCAAAASSALEIVRTIARAFASMSSLAIAVPQPTSWQLVTIIVAFAALFFYPRFVLRTIALASFVLIDLEVAAHAHGAPRDELRATFLDVGQGDAALVDLPNGDAILIDGGGLVGSPVDVGQRVIAPILRARRRSDLALVVLSHPHPDHFSGFASGLHGIHVSSFWDTGQGERESIGGPYATILANARSQGAHVSRPEEFCGAHEIGGARVDVLAPCPTSSPDRDPNDNSIVLRISYGARSFLFVGDAERAEESSLLESARTRLASDVLKVGHHGSRTSSSAAFLEAVRPSVAVISVGARNHFGHPAPETIAGLGAISPAIFRTDHDGAIIVTTDGSTLDVRRAGD